MIPGADAKEDVMADDDSQPSAKPMGFFARRSAYNKSLSDLAKQAEPFAKQQRGWQDFLKSRGGKLDADQSGFKKGGKVKKTGKAKVHKGEYVIKASAAKKAGPKKLAAMNRAPTKKPAARRGR